MNKAQKKLLNMLTYKRKEGSVGQQLFNKRFIQPIMGKPDVHGNYLCEVLHGGKVISLDNAAKVLPNSIAFMAHHDTVHMSDGLQKVFYDPHTHSAFVDGKECLGADCTTGVWLILEMIKAKVPGLYIVHTGEECGGIGSSAIVKDKPLWMENTIAAISFDRYGTNSIITHQMGLRTCSESFSSDLESILNLNLKSDSGGVYTDSYEYADDISECTNISVGYYNQHTSKEYQDVDFALKLRDALIKADWSKLKPYRDPTVMEYDDYGYGGGWKVVKNKSNGYWSNYGSSYVSKFDEEYDTYATKDDNVDMLLGKYSSIERIVEAFPHEVAEVLSEYGYDRESLIRDILKCHDSLIPF